MNPTLIQIMGTVLFTIAVIHTFSTKFFEHLAHTRPTHAGLFHLLGEVEIVFGLWAMILILTMLLLHGQAVTTAYLDNQNFTEPMFVFAIMIIAGSKPILQCVWSCVQSIAQFIPLQKGTRFYFVALSFVPLLGSLITEPAAMTLAALILRDHYYTEPLSTKLKYATLGVLFVNISIGGILTPYAAPPILMVAGKWGWNLQFMLTIFGWKAALIVMVNALSATLLFRKELSGIHEQSNRTTQPIPQPVIWIHLFFLFSVVFFSHHPSTFMGLFLFFLGFTHAYKQYQNRLVLREGLLVAFFLAGLIVLGEQQNWWLKPLLLNMNLDTIYFGATLLTAITDNAALTYLGSLVQGLSTEFKSALVAGAVTGGGLTIIANAPNPAGFSILRNHFDEAAINSFGLLLAALPPTIVAILIFRLL